MSAAPKVDRPELLSDWQQIRVLQRLWVEYKLGCRDLELLYLGARYSLASGSADLADAFLDPLFDLLTDENGHDCPACFPLRVLELEATTGKEGRQAAGARLRELASRISAATREVLDEVTQQSPAERWLFHLFHGHIGAGKELWSLWDASRDNGKGRRGSPSPPGLATIQQQASTADEQYRLNDLDGCRCTLESMLVQCGDQPEVLRNLITVAGEQRDLEAYERYWSHLVRSLLRRLFLEDEPIEAWQQLTRFYLTVATATDREFGNLPIGKMGEKLERQGLLSSWLESHSALVWLDKYSRPGSAVPESRDSILPLMREWFRIFHPDYACYLSPRGEPSPDPVAREVSEMVCNGLTFDPERRFLERFAEWSKCDFGIDPDNRSHLEAVLAMTDLVRSLPLDGHVPALAKALAEDSLVPEPLTRALEDALSKPQTIEIICYLNKEDWPSIVAFYESRERVDQLPPESQLLISLALGKEGHAAATRTLVSASAHIRKTEFDEESSLRNLWRGALRAQMTQLEELPSADERRHRLESLQEDIEGIAIESEIRSICLDDFGLISLNLILNDAISEWNACMKRKNIDGALEVVNRIPDQREQARDLKKKLLEQIDFAKTNQLVEKAVKRSKTLAGQLKFHEARACIEQLPSHHEDLRKVKADLLKQINDMESQAGDLRSKNTQIEGRLLVRGINLNKLKALASANNVDTSNPFEYNAFLRAAERQL